MKGVTLSTACASVFYGRPFTVNSIWKQPSFPTETLRVPGTNPVEFGFGFGFNFKREHLGALTNLRTASFS